jgi:hypothetical protein
MAGRRLCNPCAIEAGGRASVRLLIGGVFFVRLYDCLL